MTTIRDLVDAALAEVYGQAQTVDATTYLTEPIAADALTIPVVSINGFSRGMVQIDDELLLIDTVDRDSTSLKLAYPTGRGVRATEAVAHSTGELVTMAPSVPRFRAVQAVSETLTGSPGLFRVGFSELTYIATVAGYPLPGVVEDVLDVSWFPPGPTHEWLPVRRWTWDQHNRLLVLGDAIQPGRPVRVSWSAAPLAPGQDEDFAETGLPDTCIDVIRYGAAWRLISFIEPFNLLAVRAEAEAMDRTKTPGTRLRVAQYLYSLFQQRLEEEATDLKNRYPVRVHYAGRW